MRNSIALLLASICFLCCKTLFTQTTPPAAASSHEFNVRDFGAVGDGRTLDMPAISRAIDAAATSGGGRVIFPPGSYRTGTFELKSNVTLDLLAGAVILGSQDLADYSLGATLGFGKIYGVNSSGEGDRVGIIVARDVENVAIIGQGAIDGNGDTFFDFTRPHASLDYDPRSTRNPDAFVRTVHETGDGPVEMKPDGRPGTLIILSHSRNITIRDVTLRNAPNWTLHLQHSSHAVIAGLRIDNNLAIPNNDGIDCMDCRDIQISDCDIRAGDDDFAIVGSEDIHVTNCSLISRSSAIRLEDTRYSTFSNLTMKTNRGIGVFERGGGNTSDILFSDMVIRTTLPTGHWWGKAEPIYIVTAGQSTDATGGVRKINFRNIIAEAESGILIYGVPENPIRDISFDHVNLSIHSPRPAVAAGVGGNFDLRWTSPRIETAVLKHDIPAVYCRWVSGFRIDGLDLTWQQGLPDYFSNGIGCEDFRDLSIQDFRGSHSPEYKGAAIDVARGRGLSIRDSVASDGTQIFLRAKDLSDPRFFLNNDLAGALQTFAPNRPAFVFAGNRTRTTAVTRQRAQTSTAAEKTPAHN